MVFLSVSPKLPSRSSPCDTFSFMLWAPVWPLCPPSAAFHMSILLRASAGAPPPLSAHSLSFAFRPKHMSSSSSPTRLPKASPHASSQSTGALSPLGPHLRYLRAALLHPVFFEPPTHRMNCWARTTASSLQAWPWLDEERNMEASPTLRFATMRSVKQRRALPRKARLCGRSLLLGCLPHHT